MPKLTILTGPPASSKSTWAKKQVENRIRKTIRVNRDDLRIMLHDGLWAKGVTEPIVIQAEESLVVSFLELGYDVIVDDTNLTKRHIQQWRNLVENSSTLWQHSDFELEIEVKVFDTPIEECIKRDSTRPNSVGEEVIRNAFKRWENREV